MLIEHILREMQQAEGDKLLRESPLYLAVYDLLKASPEEAVIRRLVASLQVACLEREALLKEKTAAWAREPVTLIIRKEQ